MPCPSLLFARGGERQIKPFKIEVKVFGVLLQCKSSRPWGSLCGLPSVPTVRSHMSLGPSQNVSWKLLRSHLPELAPWLRQAVCPPKGQEVAVGHGTELFVLHRDCTEAWPGAPAPHSIGRGGHRRDRFAWWKDTYPPFYLATWHVLYLGFIAVS